MKLNYKYLESPSDRRPIVILHGVFGSLDNWMTIGRKLAAHFPVYLVDQRNHGHSPHSSEFNYPVMADDLAQLLEELHLHTIHLLGHSMGGKTAMFFSGQQPERLASLTVIDIAPRHYPPHHQQIFRGFRAVDPATLSSRQEALERISRVITHPAIQQFLLKNLQRDNQNRFSWKLNLDAIEKNAEFIGAPLPDGLQFKGPALFVKGGLSGYITEGDPEDISRHFPQARLVEIPDAGHWVHAEQPQKLLDTLLTYYASLDT